MKANWFMMSLVAVATLVNTGIAAPKAKAKAVKPAQPSAAQIQHEDMQSLKAEVEKLSIEVKRVADQNPAKTPGQLVADAGVVASDATPSLSATAPSADASKYILGLELRPSYYVSPEQLASENTITAGIQFNKSVSLVYEQYVDTITKPGERIGYDPKIQEGAARILVNNIWESKSLGLTFSYENRSLLPWSREKRDAGRIVANRNYLKLKKTITDGVTITFAETPIFFAHTQDLATNESFENRFYIIPEASLLNGKLYVGLPIWLQSTTYRGGNSQFQHKLLAWPEVTYNVGAGIDLGAAYYTDNMINPNFDGFNISNGLDKGVAQLVLRATL